MKKLIVAVSMLIMACAAVAQSSPTYPSPPRPTSCTTVCTSTYCSTVCS